jgi:tetratricopeptide (TPR) repeat protein
MKRRYKKCYQKCYQTCIAFFLLCVSSVTLADCIISTEKPAAESIESYEACIASGHQMVSDLRTALGAVSFKAKDYKTAITHFSEIIETTERPAKAYFNRGLTYLELGKERKALADLESANSILPGYSPAHFYKGVTLDRMRRYQQAIEAFSMAESLSAGGAALAPVYLERAETERSLRDRESSIESLGKAIQADPKYSRAYFARALLHEKNNNFALAIADYNEYIELKPESAEAYYNRGLIYQDLRQDHLALQDFNEALALNPRFVKARASKGITYLWPVLPVLLVLFLG